MSSGTGMLRLHGAVMAHPRRVARAEALAAALGGGRAALVVDPDPGGKPSALRTTIAAWSSVPPGATHQVVLHDDMAPARGFWELADAAVAAFPEAALGIFAFWNSRNGAAVRLAALAGARWVEPVNEYFPCTALILPKDVALGYAEFARRAGDAWPEDLLLHRYLRRAGVPALVAAPSLAQHQDLGSLSGNDFHGPRRGACFHDDLRGLRPDDHSVLTGLRVVPFFKHGVAQCAVRVPGTSAVRWESVATERYLARLGIEPDDLEARFSKADLPDQDPVALRGTWLTAYAMGLVGPGGEGDAADEDGAIAGAFEGAPATRTLADIALADIALGTIAPGGMCHSRRAEEIEELQSGLLQVARSAWEAGREDRLDGPARSARRAAALRAAAPVVLLGASEFPGPQAARGLADRGHRVVCVGVSPAEERYPDLEHRVLSELTESALADVLSSTGAVAVVDLSGAAGVPPAGSGAGPAGSTAAPLPRLIRVLNPGEVYGPGMPADSRVSEMVTQALRSEPVTVDPEAPATFRLSHVDDLVEALHRALAEPADGPAHGPADGSAGRWRAVEAPAAGPFDEPGLGRLVARAVRPMPVVEVGSGRVLAGAGHEDAAADGGHRAGLITGLRAFGQWVAYESDAPWT